MSSMRIRGRALVAGAVTFALAALMAPVADAAGLRVGVASFPSSLDPQAATGNDGAPIIFNLFEPLIERQPNGDNLVYRPGLATAWKQVSPTELELTLRQGVKFHDGSVMTADDVKYSLERAFKLVDARFADAVGRFLYNFDRVDIVSPTVIRIVAKKPEPLFEALLSMREAGITSKAYVERVGINASLLAPIGTGPYKVVKHTPGEVAKLARFDDYWGDKAPLDTLDFIRIPEVGPRITALVNDEVDIIASVPPDQESLIPTDRFKIAGVTWPMFHLYVVKMTDPVLSNAKIRQAMNLAIDRDQLTAALWAGKGKAATGHQFAEYGAPFYMPDVAPIKYDPKRAAELVKEAGYKGEPIKISFQPNYYLYMPLASQAIQDMWKKVGLNVELEQVDKYDNAKTQIRPWSNPMYFPDPMGAMDPHWSVSSWVVRDKFFAPQSPEWPKLYEAARFGQDVATRKDAYRKLIELGEQEAGWILLYQPYESFAMRKDISWQIPRYLRPYTMNFRAGEVSVGAK